MKVLEPRDEVCSIIHPMYIIHESSYYIDGDRVKEAAEREGRVFAIM